MANLDNPRGFCNPRSKTVTGAFSPVKLKSSGSAVIGVGSPIKALVAGRAIASIMDEAIVYVAISPAAAVADAEFYALRAADYYFEIQVDDNTITDDTDVGESYELLYTAVDALTNMSQIELDGSTVGQPIPLVTIVELIERPDSDPLLANNAVLVSIP
jgi:hypothetical protein